MQTWCQIISSAIPRLQRFVHNFRGLQLSCAQCSREQQLPASSLPQSALATGRGPKSAAVDGSRRHEEKADHKQEQQLTSARVEPCKFGQAADQKMGHLQSHTYVQRAQQAQVSEIGASSSIDVRSPFKKQLLWHPSKEKSTSQSSLTRLHRPLSAASTSQAQTPGTHQHLARQSCKVKGDAATHNI